MNTVSSHLTPSITQRSQPMWEVAVCPGTTPVVGLLNACGAEWPFLLCLQNLACGEDSALKGDSAVGVFEEQKGPVQLTKH